MTTDIKEKTATKTAEQKIVDALSKVLPDAVWPVVLPQDPAYPAFSFNRINYELKSESPDLNPLRLNTGTGNKSTFQMVIYAKQYTKCAALLRQAKQAMESEGLVLESVEDGYEFEQLVFVIVTEWSIWGELEADNRKPANQYPVLAKITKAIIQTLKDNFECIPCIELYHPNKRQLTTPALILETESLAMGASLGDGRTPLRISFVLHCLMPEGTDDANLQGLAALVCQLIYQNTWQQDNLSFPDNFSIIPAAGFPSEFGFSRWTVAWQQTLYMGQSIWADDDAPVPGSKGVLAGTGKATGPDFVNEYEEVVGEN